MTEDRQDGPLGFDPEDDEPARPSAAQRLAANDETEAPEGVRPPLRRSGLPSGVSRYGWFLGVVLVLVLALVTINSFNTEGVSSRGLEPGTPAPSFAAPLASSDLEGDVNVATKADQGSAGDVPACSIRRPDVLTLCALTDEAPVVLAFFATRGGSCVDELDVVQAVARRHPDVRFAAISIRGDRDGLRELIERRGWDFPIGYDNDGVLANLYGVAVCPQIAYIKRGGETFDTTLGKLGVAELDRYVNALKDGRRRVGETTP
ncbi:TlpA family protein disulfide reductase [Paraconexibacter sp.]|uniref:TlpA family protein disulfide reductase n=1 Tax=Paraconexibacter sp. TaxID=2949640 RepID=UPI0035649532